MSLDLNDTIAAIASAPGGALRGIVRISGPHALTIAASVVEDPGLFAAARSERPTCVPVLAGLPLNLPPCPATLYAWPTERSYTRQPAAELHLPGSRPLLEAALAAVCKAGARLARPGEFTLRAFLAGRLDLTQAEAVLGVIDAHSQAELNGALTQLAGGIGQPLAALRGGLLDLLAHLEAGLDFVDEDIEFISHAELRSQLDAALQDVEKLAERMSLRRQAGHLPRVVLIGPPNAGKSSLFNALLNQDTAIVAPLAGTTRDHLVCRTSFDGVQLELVDTAGEDEAADAASIAAMAQQLRGMQVAQADLLVACREGYSAVRPGREDAIAVWTKCDCEPVPPDKPELLPTSSHTGEGLDKLRRRIADCLRRAPADAAVVAGTADRCRDSLRRSADALRRALAAAHLQSGDELVAAEVRTALDEIGQVVGVVYTDDVLDRIFSRFCIGK